MTLCPGKKAEGMYGYWERDLDADLRVLREKYRADVLVSLMEDFEYEKFGVTDMFSKAESHGIETLHLPIEDEGIPRGDRHEGCVSLVKAIVGRLGEEQSVVVHCRGGLGRSGVVTACVLVALGWSADGAIREARRARPGAVDDWPTIGEHSLQEQYVCEFEQELRDRA